MVGTAGFGRSGPEPMLPLPSPSPRLDDEKVMDYFNRLSKIPQQLSGSPAEINDFTFLYHIFRTLRQVPKFQMTVGFLQNDMQASGLAPDVAVNRIEAAEQMHDEDNNIGDTSTTVEGLYASGRRGRGSGRDG